MEEDKYYDPNKPFAPFFDPNIQILKELVIQGKSQDEINDMWSEFLNNGNPRLRQESDDKTLILAVRLENNHTKPEGKTSHAEINIPT